MRIESPMADLHLFRIPLGTWGWQAFMGRMDNHPVLSSAIQDPSWRSRAIASQGTPEAPLLMGYRAQAQFGPKMEFYMNYLNFWSGTLNGQGLASGYNLGNYATAIFGLKDSLSEANIDYTSPNPGVASPQRVKSASELDVGFRLQVDPLARLLGADMVHLYISRGSKSELWPVGVFVKSPFRYLGDDISKDFKNLVHLDPAATWNQPSRYAAPSLANPNDTVGILVAWPGIRFGLEYFDGVDGTSTGHRTFTSPSYLTGFYYYGDPLGNAVGGEAISTTAKLEWDLTARLTSATTLIRGFRPFRDNVIDWQLDHPGQTAGKNRFTDLQQTLNWKLRDLTTLGLGAAWQREGAVGNVTGVMGNGFAWFADVTFHWPVRN
jgi:hypothetical protein